jgi:Glycosyltransferase like family
MSDNHSPGPLVLRPTCVNRVRRTGCEYEPARAAVTMCSESITFVVAVNDEGLFRRTLLASPCISGAHPHEILAQKRFTSAALAYNDALRRSKNDLVVFVHQDVFLPESWIGELRRALEYLNIHDPKWGVLGCAGMTQEGKLWGNVYSAGLGVIGSAFETPKDVQTLDELLLIVRKSSGIEFDGTLPHFHCYGADICLRAASAGLSNYALSAYCVHNTREVVILPREFYECCRHLRRVWRHALPIQTTCIRMTRWNLPIWKRRLKEVYLRYIRRKVTGAPRLDDISVALHGSAESHL